MPTPTMTPQSSCLRNGRMPTRSVRLAGADRRASGTREVSGNGADSARFPGVVGGGHDVARETSQIPAVRMVPAHVGGALQERDAIFKKREGGLHLDNVARWGEPCGRDLCAVRGEGLEGRSPATTPR